jgi:hypothetical protein
VRALGGQENGSIWIADVDTGNVRQVIPNMVGLGVGWSSDGQWLVASRALVSGQASEFLHDEAGRVRSRPDHRYAERE